MASEADHASLSPVEGFNALAEMDPARSLGNADLCGVFCCNEKTIRRWAKTGILPAGRKVGLMRVWLAGVIVNHHRRCAEQLAEETRERTCEIIRLDAVS